MLLFHVGGEQRVCVSYTVLRVPSVRDGYFISVGKKKLKNRDPTRDLGLVWITRTQSYVGSLTVSVCRYKAILAKTFFRFKFARRKK